MKKLLCVSTASLMAIAIASPALAGGCQWGAHAKYESTKMVSADEKKVEEAMTTFDPQVIDTEIKPEESVKEAE